MKELLILNYNISIGYQGIDGHRYRGLFFLHRESSYGITIQRENLRLRVFKRNIIKLLRKE